MDYFGYDEQKEKRKKKKQRNDDTKQLQEELKRKLEEQEMLKGELEEIRSLAHTSCDRSERDVVEEPEWSDTTGSPTVRYESLRSMPITNSTMPSDDDVDERYRQRLARLEKMVLSDEQTMLEKEESLKTQLAEKEQLLKKFENELNRCNSIPPSSVTKEEKTPLSPGDTPPNNALSPSHESPAGAAKPLPHSFVRKTNKGSSYEMFSLGMQAFESVTGSPTPLQKIAASPSRLSKSERVKARALGEASTQTERVDPQRRSNSLRREDYPEGQAGDDMWMRRVESVVQGSAPTSKFLHGRKIISPTRTRRVSFSSPPEAVVPSAFISADPQQTQTDPPHTQIVQPPPVTPVSEPTQPSSRPVSPVTPVPDSLTPGNDMSMKDDVVSFVCEKIVPMLGSAPSKERRSVTPVTVAAQPVEGSESENKLEHYTLLVKQFEDTVLKLSGCVEKKTEEVRQVTEQHESSSAAWQQRFDANNEEWERKYQTCNAEWQLRISNASNEWVARFEQNTAELEAKCEKSETEVARLTSVVQSLCSGSQPGDGANYSELEGRFSDFASNLKKDVQQREASWKQVQDRSTAEICRLQSDVSSCQGVIAERNVELGSANEKLLEIAKEVDGKEEKIQCLLAKQHELSVSLEKKQDIISEMQLTHAQYKDATSGDEIREMVVELKRDYMRLYEERKNRDDQEVKDFYAFCKEQMELKEAKLEETKQHMTTEMQNLLLRQHSLKHELAELQHKFDISRDALQASVAEKQVECDELSFSKEKLRLDMEHAVTKKVQLEKALSLTFQDQGGSQPVVQMQQELEQLARTKQSREIEYQGVIDGLKKNLHEKELQISALSIKATNMQQLEYEMQQRDVNLNALQQQVAELSQALQEKDTALQQAEERMKEEFQKQYHDLQQVQGQFGQYEGEVSVLKAQLAETQAVAEKCRIEMEVTQQRAASQDVVVRELSQERDTLKEQLEWIPKQQYGLAQLQAHQQNYMSEGERSSITPQPGRSVTPTPAYQASTSPQVLMPVSMPVPQPPVQPVHAVYSSSSHEREQPSTASPPTMWHMMYDGQHTDTGPFQPEGQFQPPSQPPPTAFSPPSQQLYYPSVGGSAARRVTIVEPTEESGRVSPSRVGMRPPRPVNSP